MRQHLSGDALRGRLCLTFRIAGSGTAVNVGRGIPVIAHHHFRAEGWGHRHHGGQRYHFTLLIPRLQRTDTTARPTKRRVRLDPHLVYTSELVEVVYVEGPQIYLHGVEHVFHRHTELLCFHSVQVDIQLRVIDLVAGEGGA